MFSFKYASMYCLLILSLFDLGSMKQLLLGAVAWSGVESVGQKLGDLVFWTWLCQPSGSLGHVGQILSQLLWEMQSVRPSETASGGRAGTQTKATTHTILVRSAFGPEQVSPWLNTIWWPRHYAFCELTPILESMAVNLLPLNKCWIPSTDGAPTTGRCCAACGSHEGAPAPEDQGSSRRNSHVDKSHCSVLSGHKTCVLMGCLGFALKCSRNPNQTKATSQVREKGMKQSLKNVDNCYRE